VAFYLVNAEIHLGFKGRWGLYPYITSDLDSYGDMHCLLDMKLVQNILVPVTPKIRENSDQ
jgi:hypothetical protein